MRTLVAFSALLLALAACGEPATRPADSPPTALPAQPLASATLTPDGIGLLRVGMSVEDAQALFGGMLEQSAANEDNPGCAEWSISREDAAGITLMSNDGRINRIILNSNANFATAEGIRIGSTLAQVRAAYPNGVSENAEYFPAPAQEFFVWSNEAEAAGLHFEMSQAEVVTSMDAGSSLRHIGGCF